jgi:hypothetical protein
VQGSDRFAGKGERTHVGTAEIRVILGGLEDTMSSSSLGMDDSLCRRERPEHPKPVSIGRNGGLRSYLES